MKTLKHSIMLSILITGLFYLGLYQIIKYVEQRDNQIFKDGVEVGRYTQLNEDAENTQLEIQIKRESSKAELLNNLARLESRGGKEIKILDTNGRYSLGKFHFQAHTVQDLYKRYYGKKITLSEAVEIALNDDLATKLAHDAIFVKKETYHWKISLCKLGVIKENCLTQKQINNLFAKK